MVRIGLWRFSPNQLTGAQSAEANPEERMMATPTNTGDMKRIELRIERSFGASPSRVFRAWTDAETMARWMWASLGRDAWAECDLRVGGTYRVYSRCDGGHHQGEGWSGMCGLFVEVEPDHKLVYTLHWDANVGYNQGGQLCLDEVVSVTITPSGEDARVSYVHWGLPDDGVSVPTHRAGIEESFDMLAALL